MNIGITMKILVLDAYFEPEQTSFSHLEKDLIEAFVKNGHEFFVICPTPTRGISKEIAKKYAKIKRETLYNGKVHVTRFWAPQEKHGIFSRAVRYFWCNYRMYCAAKKIGESCDIIFSNSTPPTQGLIADKLKKKLHKPFIYNLQDVFPDSLVNSGMTKRGSLLWKIGRKIENKTYEAADRIIVISEDFKKNILAKGVSEEKIKVVYNWIDSDLIKPVKKENNPLFEEFGIARNTFIVLYAGNFGAAQGIRVILDAAELIKDREDICFVLFGGGAEFESIQQDAQKRNLENVKIFSLLPQERVAEVYSLGDVALITCKKGFGNCAFPSKTWSIMACNTPIIASYDQESELAKVIKEANAGEVVCPENAEALARAILKAKDQSRLVDCRDYLREKADRTTCVQKYVELFENALKQEKMSKKATAV